MSAVHYFPEKLNAVVDSVVGGSNFFGLSEKGLLGQQIDLSASEARVLSNTAIGTLYEGTYQYVKIASDAPNTGDEVIGIGRAVFWTDFDDFTVTTDSTAATQDRTRLRLRLWPRLASMFGFRPRAARRFGAPTP
jgi:hypothetical protein